MKRNEMSLGFNTIDVKCSDDLRKALLVKMEAKKFAFEFGALIARFGQAAAVHMLAHALFDMVPLIEPTHEIVDNFDKSGDVWDHRLREIG